MEHKTSSKDAVTTPLVAAGAIAFAWSAFAASIFLGDPQGRDFGSFYASGADWLSGEPLYSAEVDYPNLNPPIVAVAVFAPLATLPVHTAAAIWLTVGVLALVSMLMIVFAELGAPRAARGWAVVVLLASMGSVLAWSQGQLTWVLLVPITLAWRHFRRHQPYVAGAWLAPVIVVKPFMVALPLVLGPRVALTAVPVSLGLTILGVALTGPTAWSEWLALGGMVKWLAWPANASVWGVLSRATGGLPTSSPFSGIPAAVTLAGAALLVGGAVASYRSGEDPDRRYLAGACLALLASPLGWVYYAPWILGPYLALVFRTLTWTDRAAMAMLMIPMPLLGVVADPPWLYATAGSVYAWGLLLIWSRAVR